jgi:hypothetical protein
VLECRVAAIKEPSEVPVNPVIWLFPVSDKDRIIPNC